MDNPYDTAKPKNRSVLGPSLKFKGELTADEELLIQGQVEGSIKHTSSLTIGEQGQVRADIEAEYITVEGKVQGDLRGSKSVMVYNTADIKGNIISPTVSLVEGATFNGTIQMKDPSAVKAQTPPDVPGKSREARSEEAVSTSKRSHAEKKSASAA